MKKLILLGLSIILLSSCILNESKKPDIAIDPLTNEGPENRVLFLAKSGFTKELWTPYAGYTDSLNNFYKSNNFAKGHFINAKGEVYSFPTSKYWDSTLVSILNKNEMDSVDLAYLYTQSSFTDNIGEIDSLLSLHTESNNLDTSTATTLTTDCYSSTYFQGVNYYTYFQTGTNQLGQRKKLYGIDDNYKIWQLSGIEARKVLTRLKNYDKSLPKIFTTVCTDSTIEKYPDSTAMEYSQPQILFMYKFWDHSAIWQAKKSTEPLWKAHQYGFFIDSEGDYYEFVGDSMPPYTDMFLDSKILTPLTINNLYKNSVFKRNIFPKTIAEKFQKLVNSIDISKVYGQFSDMIGFGKEEYYAWVKGTNKNLTRTNLLVTEYMTVLQNISPSAIEIYKTINDYDTTLSRMSKSYRVPFVTTDTPQKSWIDGFLTSDLIIRDSVREVWKFEYANKNYFKTYHHQGSTTISEQGVVLCYDNNLQYQSTCTIDYDSAQNKTIIWSSAPLPPDTIQVKTEQILFLYKEISLMRPMCKQGVLAKASCGVSPEYQFIRGHFIDIKGNWYEYSGAQIGEPAIETILNSPTLNDAQVQYLYQHSTFLKNIFTEAIGHSMYSFIPSIDTSVVLLRPALSTGVAMDMKYYGFINDSTTHLLSRFELYAPNQTIGLNKMHRQSGSRSAQLLLEYLTSSTLNKYDQTPLMMANQFGDTLTLPGPVCGDVVLLKTGLAKTGCMPPVLK